MSKKSRGFHTAIKRSASDRAFQIVVYALLSLFTGIILFPILNIIATSFSSYSAVVQGRVWVWPVEVQLETYKAVFSSKNIFLGYRNTLFYTAAGTCVNLIVTICAAYPLAFSDLKGRGALSGFFAFTMLFSGGMVPTYIIVNKLGMLDTVWAMLIPGALSVWNMIIMRTFFQNSIPRELYEAATIDGCSDLRYLFNCVIPLSGSIIAVIALYYAVGHWNGYFNAMLYLNTKRMYPLQIFLREMLLLGQMESDVAGAMSYDLYAMGASELIKYAVIVVSSVPMMVIYVFIQRFFVKGVMIGAIKG